MELKECRLKLAEERRVRLKVESKLTEVINAVSDLISKYIPVQSIMVEAVKNGFIQQEFLVYHAFYQSSRPSLFESL